MVLLVAFGNPKDSESVLTCSGTVEKICLFK